MTDYPCPSCSAATPDGLPCFDCVNRLLSDLRTIGELWPAILERRVTGDKGPIGKGGSVGLSPIPDKRKEAMDGVRNTLGTWMRDLGADVPDDVTAWCEWLVRHVPEMRSHPAAGELIEDISSCWHTVTRLVDIPADKVLVGFCPICAGETVEWLYAEPTAVQVVCRRCKAVGVESVYDVEVSRAQMLEQAKPYRGTPVEVARLVGVGVGTIRAWIRKGWLTRDGAGHVEVGASLILAETMAERVNRARGA